MKDRTADKYTYRLSHPELLSNTISRCFSCFEQYATLLSKKNLGISGSTSFGRVLMTKEIPSSPPTYHHNDIHSFLPFVITRISSFTAFALYIYLRFSFFFLHRNRALVSELIYITPYPTY